MPFELDLTDLEQWQAAIDQFPVEAVAAAQAAMNDTVLFLHGRIPAYPAGQAPRGLASKYWTEKQRRFFFAALRRGQIKVPYQRTGGLGRSFTTRVTLADDGVLGEVGTNYKAAPWVVGPSHPGETIGGRQMYQARIHQGRWWQFESVLTDNADEATQVFADEFFHNFFAAVVHRYLGPVVGKAGLGNG